MILPRRALIIKLRHHGDVLLSTPVFSALQQAVPSCEIDALIYSDTRPMLEGHPAIAQIHEIDRDWKRQSIPSQLAAEWRLFSALRERQYDWVIHLSIHPRGAWLTRLLRPQKAVAPHRLNEGRFWTGSFTHFYPAQSHPQRHTVESNLDALRALGLNPPSGPLVLNPGEFTKTRGDRFIHIHPTSRWLFKCWTVEKMARLADALIERGYPVVLTSAPTPREMEWMAALRSAMQKTALDFSGQLSLKELAALTARALLFVGVDSAPMHIAAAMGTPTVVLFGPSGDREWGPWQVPHRILVSKVHPCRPCGSDGCNHSKVSECLTTLSVEEVLAACEELLEKKTA
ncbi:MAG: putative lipopolysaccharide heptosyltransferase III [Rhodocyclaceae bacterium]|nr:putative lipopolysaccharide heptosyltransferase III [Rhodocyclaceae bacterium]